MSKSDHPEPRMDLVNHVREQIAAGTYATDGKLRATAEALTRALKHPPGVNVWELLTHRGHCSGRGDDAKRHDQAVERSLSGTARMAGQEIELGPVYDGESYGWVLTVFSCHDRGEDGAEEIRIFIPQRAGMRPRVEHVRKQGGEWLPVGGQA